VRALAGLLLQRVEPRGRLYHAGQQRGLVKCQILGLFPEIMAAGTVQTDNVAAAELDLVEIGRQEFLLADGLVEQTGIPEFGPFPLQGRECPPAPQVVQHEVFQKLHGDGAAAAAQPAPQDRQERDHIDPTVIEIALVLDGDDGLLHHGGNFRRRQNDRAAAIRVPSRSRPGDHDLG
jgi:hypothetical protein